MNKEVSPPDKGDENVSIIGVTIPTVIATEEGGVVGKDKDDDGPRSSSNYLLRKLKIRLWSIQQEIQVLLEAITRWKQRMKE